MVSSAMVCKLGIDALFRVPGLSTRGLDVEDADQELDEDTSGAFCPTPSSTCSGAHGNSKLVE